MPMGMVFWAIMIIWLVFGLIWWRQPGFIGGYGWAGNGLILFVLFFLLGWHEFGFIIR